MKRERQDAVLLGFPLIDQCEASIFSVILMQLAGLR
jgi:hypothetical protein